MGGGAGCSGLGLLAPGAVYCEAPRRPGQNAVGWGRARPGEAGWGQSGLSALPINFQVCRGAVILPVGNCGVFKFCFWKGLHNYYWKNSHILYFNWRLTQKKGSSGLLWVISHSGIWTKHGQNKVPLSGVPSSEALLSVVWQACRAESEPTPLIPTTAFLCLTLDCGKWSPWWPGSEGSFSRI